MKAENIIFYLLHLWGGEKVPALRVCNSSVLALFASGRTRGLALEVGGGVAHAVPVFEGFALNHAVLRLEGAGQDITHQLKLMLEQRGHHLAVSQYCSRGKERWEGNEISTVLGEVMGGRSDETQHTMKSWSENQV